MYMLFLSLQLFSMHTLQLLVMSVPITLYTVALKQLLIPMGLNQWEFTRPLEKAIVGFGIS
jgi:hypothetical protein